MQLSSVFRLTCTAAILHDADSLSTFSAEHSCSGLIKLTIWPRFKTSPAAAVVSSSSSNESRVNSTGWDEIRGNPRRLHDRILA